MQILKVIALYVMWNPEICQDPPTCGQDDLVLFLNFDVMGFVLENRVVQVLV